MTAKRIFVTGASGCVGHYLAEALIQETSHELFLLVRNPDKLKVDYHARSGVHILKGDMRSISQFAELLKTMNVAILTATAWGGTAEVFDTNVTKTVQLVKLLDPDVCEQVIYFSTESILDRHNQLLKEAKEIGTDYIRSKYECHQQLSQLAIAPKITTVFPTLVFGGDQNKPYSHITAGLPEIAGYVGLIRFLKADASFHFIHAKDIAQVVRHLVDRPPAPGESRQLVLGNAPMTVNQAVEEVCAYFNKKIYFRIPLTYGFANLIILLFRIQVAAWDRFCLKYRHFTHQDAISPATFGLPTYCATITDLLKLSGIHPAVKS
jgi:nucleoside-diphosphate-sugar epimerase